MGAELRRRLLPVGLAACGIVAVIVAVLVTRPGATNSGQPATHPSGLPTPTPSQPSASAARPAEPHVMLIIEENRGYDGTLGACSADPYLCSLAAQYASYTAWFAVAHPSAPNYLVIDSGSTQGITSDCTPDGGGCGPFDAEDLGAELSAAAIPWVAYMEGLPAPCDRVDSSGAYVEKHDPFMYFSDDRGQGCAAHILPYPGAARMDATLDASGAPDFVWITPNLQHDMHDGSVANGDAWLRSNLPGVLASAWFADHGTVIITMDENDASPAGSCCGAPAGGRIPMVVISAVARGRGGIASPGDLYGTLRGIEQVFGLPFLGNASRPDNGDLTPMFG